MERKKIVASFTLTLTVRHQKCSTENNSLFRNSENSDTQLIPYATCLKHTGHDIKGFKHISFPQTSEVESIIICLY